MVCTSAFSNRVLFKVAPLEWANYIRNGAMFSFALNEMGCHNHPGSLKICGLAYNKAGLASGMVSRFKLSRVLHVMLGRVLVVKVNKYGLYSLCY